MVISQIRLLPQMQSIIQGKMYCRYSHKLQLRLTQHLPTSPVGQAGKRFILM